VLEKSQVSDRPQRTPKSERTRTRILDAAAHALATRGYAATSLRGIAESIDMQDASLYYHFASKDELVLEVLAIGTALAHDAVEEALAASDVDADPVAALRSAIVAHATAVLGGGDYPRANVRSYGQLPPEVDAVHRSQQRAYGAVWTGVIDAAIDGGHVRADLDPSATRLLILGALNWAIEWYRPGGALDPADLGQQLATIVLSGLREE
jgi:AcrR family transcriptional regulator